MSFQKKLRPGRTSHCQPKGGFFFLPSGASNLEGGDTPGLAFLPNVGGAWKTVVGASVAAACLGCSGDMRPVVDAGPDAGLPDGGSVPVSLSIAATVGSLAVPFDFSISTVGEVTVDVTHGVGTVQRGNGPALSAFTYERIVWGPSEPGLVLYQLLAVGAEDWQVVYVYCQGAEVSGVYSEATNAPLVLLEATGSCAGESTAETTEQVNLPADNLLLDGLEQAVSVSGPSLQLGPDAVGTMTLSGAAWSVYPFNFVDCSSSCGTPGWYELHSIFWSPGQTCFGIYYLFPNTPDYEQLSYAVCLPDLSDPTGGGATFDSSWALR